ncbi:LRRNT 2 domain-containing protein [Citrus sinensis]|uniref:LRRNT 2 domain-containing protein n=1 Tax=Citrus sinensis TaxID=2711 RepID=A0ACB8IRA3_CITSI|nr:LRRNT 2 domain-containing protein [Citrus sinensis]
MKSTMSVFVALFFLELFTLANMVNLSFCTGYSYVGCIDSEREALLKLKQDLIDPSNRLASWVGDGDCCKWAGVICSDLTCYVLQLSLRNPFDSIGYSTETDLISLTRFFSSYEAHDRLMLGGKINPSLVDLKHLIHLDLSGNNFQGIQIPKCLGSLKNLRYLNLTAARFAGKIPHQLGNLSNLQYLDLSDIKLHVDKFSWLSGLSLLEHLDLSRMNLSKASDLLPVANSLPSLKVLKLSESELHQFAPLSSVNFSSLIALDLSGNYFDSSLFQFGSCFFGHHRLVFLKLSANEFHEVRSNSLQGTISSMGLENLTSIKTLDLSFNEELGGQIPTSFVRLCPLPPALGELSSMTKLDLFSNTLKGNNFFSGSLPISIGNLSCLQLLNLRNNRIVGIIPVSIQNCLNLNVLDMGENEFVGDIPAWMGERFSANSSDQDNAISYIRGGASDVFEDASVVTKGFMVEYNTILNLVKIIDISNNNFSGVPKELTNLMGLQSLNFSHNFFTGKIPENIGNMRSIESLDFSMNQLSGKVPQSMSSLSFLNHLNLSYNNLTGKIPSSTQLQSMDASSFAGNNLCGAPLPNCPEKNALVPEDRNENGNEDEDEVDWLLYVSMALGFVLGFWCFMGPLLSIEDGGTNTVTSWMAASIDLVAP